MILIDLTPFGKGKGVFVQDALDEAGITVNKNTIPNESSSAFYPSGIRLGTSTLTTRGMKENEMEEIAEMFKIILDNIDNESIILKVRDRVQNLCENFSLYDKGKKNEVS